MPPAFSTAESSASLGVGCFDMPKLCASFSNGATFSDTTIIKMTVHQRIRSFRESKGLTYQQFGDAVGVSRGAVQQWETGKTAPKRANQADVAKFMGISVAELMDATDSAHEGSGHDLTHYASEIVYWFEKLPNDENIRMDVSVECCQVIRRVIQGIAAPPIHTQGGHKSRAKLPAKPLALQVSERSPRKPRTGHV